MIPILCREKVIKDLEKIHTHFWVKYRGCGIKAEKAKYKERLSAVADAVALLKEQEEEIENLKQTAQSMMEGICLLKEQEPKPVKVVKNAYNHEFYYCPRCDRSFYDLLYGKPKFCDKCGQKVTWNE